MPPVPFTTPTAGASLLLAFRLVSKSILIVGSGQLAATRAFAALEADSAVTIIAKGGLENACDEVKWRAQHQQLSFIASEADESSIETYLAGSRSPTLVCVTDTLLGLPDSQRRSRASAEAIARMCRARNIPVNVTDMPDLCDFTFASTHRFASSPSGSPSSLQIGVTTNGRGCRLAGRIRRDIVSRLPKDVGGAVEKVAELRALAKNQNSQNRGGYFNSQDVTEDDTLEDTGLSTPNRPVPLRRPTGDESDAEGARRRMKWVAQVSEYWPLQRLASLRPSDMHAILSGAMSSPSAPSPPSQHGLSLQRPERKGRIFLCGSGPGHPALLTLATHRALTEHADLVLSDKLVPAAVLDVIPKHVEVRIARKFPGNSESAQGELMEQAVEAAKRGLCVVRLKQGDPTVYGRVSEELLHFRAALPDVPTIIIPGVSSALAAPTLACMSLTQRGVAETFVVCSPVGRGGRGVRMPGYVRSRTTVMLMGVARLPAVLAALMNTSPDPEDEGGRERGGAAYPPHLPLAIIERASMPDQRVLETTLERAVGALDSLGEQRPPGLVVLGWAVCALWANGEHGQGVLEHGSEAQDAERVEKWLGRKQWRVREGLEDDWDGL